MIMRKVIYTCKRHGAKLRDEVTKGGIKNGIQQWRCRECRQLTAPRDNARRREIRAAGLVGTKAKQFIIRDAMLGVLNRLAEEIHIKTTIAERLNSQEKTERQKAYEDEIWAMKYLGDRLCRSWGINKSILESITYDGI